MEPEDRIFVKGYGFFFAKNMGKKIGENIFKEQQTQLVI